MYLKVRIWRTRKPSEISCKKIIVQECLILKGNKGEGQKIVYCTILLIDIDMRTNLIILHLASIFEINSLLI